MKTYIQLGRYGDIINLLPLLYADNQRGQKQTLMVAKEFAPLLEGVSYVEPLIFDGPHWDIAAAVAQCKAQNRDFICTQVNGAEEVVREHVYGPAGLQHAVTTSFVKEMWRIAGRLKEWDNQPAVVFDRRSPERESSLLKRVVPKNKPIILVAAGGVSSPFPYRDLLLTLIRLKFSKKFQIVDLSEVQAERVYDLLGLFEASYCLISTDSMALHLARAVPELPVVALANDKPLLWNGSSWRPQHIFYCRYGDFPIRATQMLEAIELMPACFVDETRIVHVFNNYEGTGCDSPWLPTPIEIGACGRDSAMVLKDEKRLPFLKDCIRMGLQRCREGDFMALTRPGIHFEASVTDTLLPYEAAYAYRIVRTAEGDVFFPIVDLFFARKCWWNEILREIPDLILGNDYFWSHCLWWLFKRGMASDVTGCVWRDHK